MNRVLTLTLAVASQMPFTVSHDAAGNLIAAERELLVKSSDESIFTAELTEDGRTASLTGRSAGPGVLSFYDADSQELYVSYDVTVVLGLTGTAPEGQDEGIEQAIAGEPVEEAPAEEPATDAPAETPASEPAADTPADSGTDDQAGE